MIEIIQSEEQREKILRKKEWSLKYLWDSIKRTDIYTVGVPEGEKKGAERIFKEIMAEIPNLMKDMNINIQEIQQTPSKKK